MKLRLMICLLLASGTIFAQEAKTPAEIDKHLNIKYFDGEKADQERHLLDVYVPKGKKDFPVAMFVHGGTWRSGNKNLYGDLGKLLVENGIGAVIINYRLSVRGNGVKHPDHIEDVAKAFAWTKSNITKFGGDTKKLFISGHSAGGHLVSLLATDETYLKAVNCTVQDIKGVISISGVYNINPLFNTFTDAFSKNLKDCEAASPITHVKEKHPPFLVAYADRDLPTLDKMAEDFAKKLKDSKTDTTLKKFDQRDHISIITNTIKSPSDPVRLEVIDFISKYSK